MRRFLIILICICTVLSSFMGCGLSGKTGDSVTVAPPAEISSANPQSDGGEGESGDDPVADIIAEESMDDTVNDACAGAESLFILSALMRMGARVSYIQKDFDSDGVIEMLVRIERASIHGDNCIIIDFNDNVMKSYALDDEERITVLLIYDRDNDKYEYIIRSIYNNGDKITFDAFTWNGKEFIETEYGPYTNKDPLEEVIMLDRIMISDTTYEDDYFASLDEYYRTRENTKVIKANLNKDYESDRIYIVYRGFEKWEAVCDTVSSHGDEIYLTYNDLDVYAIAAISTNNGVYFTISQLDVPILKSQWEYEAERIEWNSDFDVLKVAGQYFSYAYTEDIFAKFYKTENESIINICDNIENLYVADLLGLSEDVVSKIMDIYYEGTEPHTAYGIINGTFIKMKYSSATHHLRYSYPSLDEIYLEPDDNKSMGVYRFGVTTDSTLQEYREKIIVMGWTSPMEAGEKDGRKIYEIHEIYRYCGNGDYELTVGFYGNEPDSEVAYIKFAYFNYEVDGAPEWWD